MAKYFIISLSPEDKTITIDETSDGKSVKKEKSLREIELIILQNILRYARNAAKKMDDVFVVTDCIDQVKNVGNNDAFIRFTKEDMDHLKTGFEAACGGPEINLWMDNCYGLMKQIKDPVEEKKDDNIKEKTKDPKAEKK